MTTASLYDKNISFLRTYSARDHSYMIIDIAYDSSYIHDIFFNTLSSPLIVTNERLGIVDFRLSHSRWEGIKIRKEEEPDTP